LLFNHTNIGHETPLAATAPLTIDFGVQIRVLARHKPGAAWVRSLDELA
jgi:hypothetical protein